MHEQASMNASYNINKISFTIGYNQSDTTIGFSGTQEKEQKKVTWTTLIVDLTETLQKDSFLVYYLHHSLEKGFGIEDNYHTLLTSSSPKVFSFHDNMFFYLFNNSRWLPSWKERNI